MDLPFKCSVKPRVLTLLDEVGKTGQSNLHGGPSAALLEVLDLEQNWNFDHDIINVPTYLSQDLFIYTASFLDTISSPLLDQCEIVHLVPRAFGVFIWATTVADFLEPDPELRFDILISRKRGDNMDGLDELYSLYSTVIRASFGHILEEEVQGVISVMGALIFAKQPLHDDMLITFPGVKVKKSNVLGLTRKGLMSVIESGPILHFHHLRISSSPPLFSEPYPISLVSKIENFMNIIFGYYGFNSASLQHGIFKHKECGYSRYCQVRDPSSCFVFISDLGKPPCPHSAQ